MSVGEYVCAGAILTVREEEHLDSKDAGPPEAGNRLLGQSARLFGDAGGDPGGREDELADVVLVHRLDDGIAGAVAIPGSHDHHGQLLGEGGPLLGIQRPVPEGFQRGRDAIGPPDDAVPPAVVGQGARLKHERVAKPAANLGQALGRAVLDGEGVGGIDASLPQMGLLQVFVLDHADGFPRRL